MPAPASAGAAHVTTIDEFASGTALTFAGTPGRPGVIGPTGSDGADRAPYCPIATTVNVYAVVVLSPPIEHVVMSLVDVHVLPLTAWPPRYACTRYCGAGALARPSPVSSGAV